LLTKVPVIPLDEGDAATLADGGGGGGEGGEALTGFDTGALKPRLDPIDIPMLSSISPRMGVLAPSTSFIKKS
jgi:hypothetical protein